ncbi:hypothetical protein BY996DRAFT_4578923 [Phakopsora pachyrhizi]|nr:hypothetical protein BY996DRAFT_4578923 [Phakopsora pachyrhizi]
MTSPIHLALVRAEYSYTPQTDDELELEEDGLYYLLEDDDPEWHKVKLKTTPTSPDPPKVGLVPANYIIPAPVIQSVVALYPYEAQTEDELTIEEDAPLNLYEDDGEWSLVGRNAQGGARGVGYVPTTYIEEAGQATDAQFEQIPPPAESSPILQPSNDIHLTGATNVVTWTVTDIDQKKKKRKGTLAVGNGTVIFASESDKAGVQKYSISDVSITKIEKGKHLILQCATEERHFQVSSKDLDDIVSKIRRTQQEAQTPSSTPVSALKNKTSPISQLTPTLRPPSTMTGSEKPPGPSGRKVSFLTPTGKCATALYDFDAQGDDELTVKEGDRLFVLDDVTDDDWWKCAKQSNGQEGVVPASYIEVDDGQPSGNPQAADAAISAAAAEDAKKRRIQEEEDAKLAQQLADEDQSEMRLANAQAADRKVAVAREAEQRKAMEAEAASRRKRESEYRSTQRREAERSMLSSSLTSGPMPPKLTARPDSAQSINFAGGLSTPAPPRRPDSAPREGRSKPQGQIRTWRDRTGQFKVEAEFRGLQNGKIRLHKINGVIIEVPLTKMSTEDVIWLEGATARSLRQEDTDEIPLAKLSLSPTSAAASSTKTRPTSESARRSNGPPKKVIDWFEFFLNAGCDLDDCTRYASNFERDRIDESLLTELESSTMRNLGLREGDVIRVRKHIKMKYGNSGETSNDQNAEQIRLDEELAKSLQDQDSSSAPNIFTNGPNGSLKTTRRGRPAPARAGSSTVDVTSLKLIDTTSSPEESSAQNSPFSAPITATTAPTENNFDDDAWQVRPNSTTPAASQVPNSRSNSSPAPAASSTAASNSLNPSHASSASNQTSLDDEIFKKIMNHGKQDGVSAPLISSPNIVLPTSATGVAGPQTIFNPNGPRGPLAPVAANAPLLNPLIPTNTGMRGFVPTTRQSLTAQPTGYQGQSLLPHQNATFLPGAMGNSLNTSSMAMQPTGMGTSNVIGSGAVYNQGMGMAQSQFAGMSQVGTMQPHLTGFNQNFSTATAPPVPLIPSAFAMSNPPSAPSAPKSFNPSDIFAQMKTGQFAKNEDLGPQDPNKYNALRPQPTGLLISFVPFSQNLIPGQPQPQLGMQPIMAQPTGFASGGYVMTQQTGMHPQNNIILGQTQQQQHLQQQQQQQQQQWRGF